MTPTREIQLSIESTPAPLVLERKVEVSIQSTPALLTLVSTTGLRVRNPTDSRKSTLSVEEKQRTLFFNRAASTQSLLKRQPLNPPLEEGKFETKENRERNGEYFITPEALAILIANDIKKYNKRKTKSVYNTKNIFVIDNNYEKLCCLLHTLHLAPGDDAKIVFVHATHAIPFYLRNDAEKIKCYIGDSQGATYMAKTIAKFVKVFMNKADVTIGPVLQKDFYSCFTFAKKTIMYFIKHGKDVFSHIEKVGAPCDTQNEYKNLSIENLMPALLKCCQSDLILSDTALDTVVSIKANKTLRQYFAENKKEFSGKSLNTAAIQKKYKYFSQLNETVTQLHADEIKPTLFAPLPVSISDTIKHCYIAPKPTVFFKVCLEIQDYILSPIKPPLSPVAYANYQSLANKLPGFDRYYYSSMSSPVRTGYSIQQSKLYHLLLLNLVLYTNVTSIETAILNAREQATALMRRFKGEENDALGKIIESIRDNSAPLAEDFYEMICTLEPSTLAFSKKM